MRWLALLGFLSFGSLVGAENPQDAPDKENKVLPQARPVVTWLKAVKKGDEDQLKAVFSERMRERFDEEGWDKVLKNYQELFKKAFGDYKLEDFTFEFTGGKEKGKLSIIHKGKKLPGLQVIKERTGWKVDER